MQEWEVVNNLGLAEIDRTDQQVELVYKNLPVPQIAQVEYLTQQEQSCCGPAGVSFEYETTDYGIKVCVKQVKPSKASETVLAAIASMKRSSQYKVT